MALLALLADPLDGLDAGALERELVELGNEVRIGSLEEARAFQSVATDGIVVLMSESLRGSAASMGRIREIGQVCKESLRFFVPVLVGTNEFPPEILEFSPVVVVEQEWSDLALRIVTALKDFSESFPPMARARQLVRDQVIGAGERYIEETLGNLLRRARVLFGLGLFWYFVGAAALILGSWISYQRFVILPANNISSGSLIRVTGLAIVALAAGGGLCRYGFLLGRAFVDEAFVLQNREHAIRYGRFFLSAFGGSVSKEDVAKVLQDWNLVSRSGFGSLEPPAIEGSSLEALLAAIRGLLDSRK